MAQKIRYSPILYMRIEVYLRLIINNNNNNKSLIPVFNINFSTAVTMFQFLNFEIMGVVNILGIIISEQYIHFI